MQIGLHALTFTEHLDFAGWQVDERDTLDHHKVLVTPDGMLAPPLLDVDGYLDCIERCRRRFPDLQILTGVEFGQPHRHDGLAAKLLDLSQLDRVIVSLHTPSGRRPAVRADGPLPHLAGREGDPGVPLRGPAHDRAIGHLRGVSDAHIPNELTRNYPEAVAMVEHFGFGSGRHPADFWTR
jgi:histidinol phosphatase-like PHP family hydrolase